MGAAYSGYIAIDGPIGVGKTTLARKLAEHLNAQLILEAAEDNPFLKNFYRDRERYAFQTQMFFLISRFKQHVEFVHRDLFAKALVADYLFAKDRIFARINLSHREFIIYEKIVSALHPDIVKPDLVIYLTASLATLMDRIKKRNRSFEKWLDRPYLELVCESYSRYFFHYDQGPLVVVKTDNCDFEKEEPKFSYLLERIMARPTSTEYISFEGPTIGGV